MRLRTTWRGEGGEVRCGCVCWVCLSSRWVRERERERDETLSAARVSRWAGSIASSRPSPNARRPGRRLQPATSRPASPFDPLLVHSSLRASTFRVRLPDDDALSLSRRHPDPPSSSRSPALPPAWLALDLASSPVPNSQQPAKPPLPSPASTAPCQPTGVVPPSSPSLGSLCPPSSSRSPGRSRSASRSTCSACRASSPCASTLVRPFSVPPFSPRARTR